MIQKIAYIVCLAVFLISCGQEKKSSEIKLAGFVFGTTYHITYVDADNQANYQKSIDSLFNLVNKSLSTYLPTSDISKINNGDTTVVVDKMFVDVFAKAKKIYKETAGYFDPTIGKLINAYGFGSGKERKNLSSKEIEKLMIGVGFDKVKLENNKVYRESDQIEFNVNAFAKGYGVDVIGWFLEDKKINNYLIEIGGEIRARGKKKGKLWKVAIEKPNIDGTRSLQKIITLDDESMATSGNYRKFKINENGKKIVHTVNPKTGLASQSNLLSVSVRLKGDCADVDAYATAFLAMGLEKTTAFLLKHPELKVVLLYNDKNNELKEFVN
ncbi:FAD:protein FMN transferase [Tenacibaculum finnmarkense]|uniref:FAD:protein FMN transferase n=1 Tax=Tenacibaculum finnmarkense TaxID=2781243 RepID=UPI00187B90A0|nr:FAD:protein FMN transferase [Tenacibaculum finnmarkense]MBE7688313.1 FAD:protein FMN transferase [Tenacibaculum finnmarkense genomovar ulcerans]MCD8410263.1 FAD:protein FMN transferase [Tenacibaculum finnmarkense genomovar ulcerans]MCG8859303.1 FAD:protein FMN transferase [Tenacibaculum finnmarkense]